MILENHVYQAINKKTSELVGEEQQQIQHVDDGYKVTSMVEFYESGNKFTIKSVIVLDKDWIPLSANFFSKESNIGTSIELSKTSAVIMVSGNSLVDRFQVRVDREDAFFIFPGAITIPYIWTRNPTNLTKPRIFQGIAGGFADMKPLRSKSDNFLNFEVKLSINGHDDIVWLLTDREGILLNGYTRNQNILINQIS